MTFDSRFSLQLPAPELRFEGQPRAPETRLQDHKPTPNNALQRPALKRTLFALAKIAPFSSAAEVIR